LPLGFVTGKHTTCTWSNKTKKTQLQNSMVTWHQPEL
jgi:hypothetical protein